MYFKVTIKLLGKHIGERFYRETNALSLFKIGKRRRHASVLCARVYSRNVYDLY